MIPHNSILQGDVLDMLDTLDDNSIDVVVTSPPYWNLRDYGVKGQWGLEETPSEYLDKLDIFMLKIKRILKDSGTVWINMGDSYVNKSLTGIPQRFYIRCLDSGWIARNIIIWYKRNAMPSSVKNRFTNQWESIFFFSKNQKYHFDLDPIREKPKTEYPVFNVRVRDSEKARFLQKETKRESILKQDNVIDPKTGRPRADYKGFNERWRIQQEGRPDSSARTQSKLRDASTLPRGSLMNPKGKNPGDHWDITAKPFKGAHFATFPQDLVERILKCSVPKDGIVLDPFCGAGTVPLVAKQLGLNWLGIELKEEYIEICKKRL